MSVWKPTQPTKLTPCKTEQTRYDQIVAEAAELLYSYFYQLHFNSIHRQPHRIESPDQYPGGSDQP